MVNNIPNSKLDEVVKETLNNYEAPYDASDWERMESMLDAAPKSVSFKWSYLLNVFIGLVVCGGAYLAYSAISSPSHKQNTETTSPILKSTTIAKPVINKPVPAPVVNDAPLVIESSVPATVSTNTVTTLPPATNSTVANNTSLIGTMKVKKTKEQPKGEVDPELLKNVRVLGMGNHPIFGDMLDSSKGIIGETQEDPEVVKAASKNKGLPPGWNSFMVPNVNPDSIKSYREKNKAVKDSVKTE